MTRIHPSAFCLLPSPLLLAGCEGLQAPLNPAGPQSRSISGNWWLYFWICLIVYVLVVAFAGLVALRNRRRQHYESPAAEPPHTAPEPQRERRTGLVIASLVALTTILLFVLMIGDFLTGRAFHAIENAPNPIELKVTGHQWWWEVQYGQEGAARPTDTFTTANEIHIPVGRPIKVLLDSADVIHSFWIPNLHGKKDMIPGHGASIWFQADKPGTYFGQCAEFCGFQHAQMRLVIVAESADQFEAWRNSQMQPAAEPTTDVQKRGQQVFLSGTCAFCHTIEGTMARARLGPDLTHVASRAKLAAGSIPNATGHLAGWIVDPQKIKPGANMPPNPLNPEDLRALLEYLSNLK